MRRQGKRGSENVSERDPLYKSSACESPRAGRVCVLQQQCSRSPAAATALGPWRTRAPPPLAPRQSPSRSPLSAAASRRGRRQSRRAERRSAHTKKRTAQTADKRRGERAPHGSAGQEASPTTTSA
eukprot:2517131-Pleurochrysis_carterae.AAC.1